MSKFYIKIFSSFYTCQNFFTRIYIDIRRCMCIYIDVQRYTDMYGYIHRYSAIYAQYTPTEKILKNPDPLKMWNFENVEFLKMWNFWKCGILKMWNFWKCGIFENVEILKNWEILVFPRKNEGKWKCSFLKIWKQIFIKIFFCVS